MENLIKEKLHLVPNLPGSYQMLDEDGTIIYVGKAKNLHRRLASYFNREQTGKTKKLVENIKDFKYIVATSETEAFLIEINLIKKYNPKYNIMLRDDKSYPYIEYISKPYPRLKISRYLNIKKKDSHYLFGPYPNTYAARRIVNLINRLYPLKKCEGMPKEVCLYYHIHECLGYCSKELDLEKVSQMEQEILSFLRGNTTVLRNKILEKIDNYSKQLNFEMALELKQELEYIDYITEKQKVELHDFVNRDVINYYSRNGYTSITIFYIRNGKLLGNKNNVLAIDTLDDIESFIANFYLRNEIPKEILIPDTLNKELLSDTLNAKFIIPEKGVKKELLNMAFTNAKISFENEFKLILADEKRTYEANEELSFVLNMPHITRIDIFDNSNLFGTFAVSGMVVFINGRPEKSEYRKYKIQIDKNDDYHTMQEVIYRRYNRALIEESVMPDLIITDGGETQIHAAQEILQDLGLHIPVVGLKKDSHHRTNVLVDSNLKEITIDTTSNLFHYLTRMQDEVHRYTINYHRTIRSKGSISSVLDNIEGIGPKRKKELIKKYGSVKNIAGASTEELSTIIPEKTAKVLKEYLEAYLKDKEKFKKSEDND